MNISIKGKVIHGDGYGKKLGFPTVNLEIAKHTEAEALPPPLCVLREGVYVGVGILERVEYRAGIIISPLGKIEAHLIGYDGDAYGKEVTLEIKKFLREYKKFETEEELKTQIQKDIIICSQE